MKMGRTAFLVCFTGLLVHRAALAQTDDDAPAAIPEEDAVAPAETTAPPEDRDDTEALETEPVAIESGADQAEPEPTEIEPAPTATEPAPLETEPAPLETEPAPTEVEPVDGESAEPPPAPSADVLEAEDEGFRSRVVFGSPARVQFSFPGTYGLRLVGQSDMLLSAVPTDRQDPEENLFGPVTRDGDPNELGQNFYVLHWLRISPQLRFLRRFRLVGQVDLLHGHIGGDDPQHVEGTRSFRSDQVGISGEGVRPRHLYFEALTPIGLFRLGQMGSDWGMGLLANEGAHNDDRFLFGDARHGDIVERLVYLTKPFLNLTEHPIRELAIFLGGDIVFDDGIADLVEGDLAWQIVGGLLWRLDPGRALGLYIAYRNQTYADGDYLRVTAIDFHGQWSLRLSERVEGYAEGEVVGVVGETNATPNLAHSELDVRQLGFAARAGVRLDRLGLDLRFEGGYASGDADTNDDRIGRFTFDADYRVGLIIFQELLGWSTARAAVIAGDEELVGEVQEGVELLPTNGSIAGASYIYPSVTWTPVHWLDLRFAVLVAQATSDVVSPFETKRRGRPASYRGGPATNRDLGLEIDLGLFTRLDIEYVQIRLGVEAAYCRPGHAFDDAEGNRLDDIALIRGRFQLDW